MVDKYLNFLYGLSCNRIGKVGIALTTGAFLTFIAIEIPRWLGILTNTYIGLLTYLILPTLFVLGLLLIPIAWSRYRRESGKTTRELLEARFQRDDVEPRLLGARLVLTVVGLSLVNVLFLGIVSARALVFMDDPVFCGTACHSVMHPEWITYQDSPHARVACVECHVGEGTEAMVASKLNGAYQMLSVALDLYERPIPTPVHQLRPARETCEKCHWPDQFYGQRLERIIRYAADEASTPRYTTLSLKVDTGTRAGVAGIHWHVAEANEVRYASVADGREEMLWVEARRPDGSYERFENRRLRGDGGASDAVRVMDCVDCHNRATHVYEDPAEAIDERLSTGAIDRRLPFIKREGLRALTRRYPSAEVAGAQIAEHVDRFYGRLDPVAAGRRAAAVDEAARVLREIYDRNVHHGMNVTWGAYPDHLGHKGTAGCLRCHNPDLVSDRGRHISQDCTLCHSIIAYGSDTPFEFLKQVTEGDGEAEMHRYLRQEFLRSLE